MPKAGLPGTAVAASPQSIVCPSCGQPIRLDEALRQHLAADLIARRESELRRTAEEDAAERVRVALQGQLAQIEEQDERLSELTGKLKQQQDAEKQLRRKQRELEDQKEPWDVERERMRDAIRKEERDQAATLQQERFELLDDANKAGAALGVIVSETLPQGMDGSGRVDEVWVCQFGYATHLATGLRWVLIAASQYEAANAARDDTSGKVYDYIATGGFASRCDAISRVVDTMMATLAKEKRYYEQKWKEWERHIETVTGSLYGIAGDLVGLGAEIPPPLRAELPQASVPALASGTIGGLSR